MSEVGIKATIHRAGAGRQSLGDAGYYLMICEPYRITQFLKRYAEGFMMQRKWMIVISAYSTTRNAHWTPEEDQFLIENYGRISYSEIAKKLHRAPRKTVWDRVQRLRRMGKLPTEDLRPKVLSKFAKRQPRRHGRYVLAS